VSQCNEVAGVWMVCYASSSTNRCENACNSMFHNLSQLGPDYNTVHNNHDSVHEHVSKCATQCHKATKIIMLCTQHESAQHWETSLQLLTKTTRNGRSCGWTACCVACFHPSCITVHPWTHVHKLPIKQRSLASSTLDVATNICPESCLSH